MSSASYHSDHRQVTSVCLLVICVASRNSESLPLLRTPESKCLISSYSSFGGWITLYAIAYCYCEILMSINSIRHMLMLHSEIESP